jgi:hypothetical protein
MAIRFVLVCSCALGCDAPVVPWPWEQRTDWGCLPFAHHSAPARVRQNQRVGRSLPEHSNRGDRKTGRPIRRWEEGSILRHQWASNHRCPRASDLRFLRWAAAPARMPDRPPTSSESERLKSNEGIFPCDPQPIWARVPTDRKTDIETESEVPLPQTVVCLSTLPFPARQNLPSFRWGSSSRFHNADTSPSSRHCWQGRSWTVRTHRKRNVLSIPFAGVSGTGRRELVLLMETISSRVKKYPCPLTKPPGFAPSSHSGGIFLCDPPFRPGCASDGHSQGSETQ